MADAPRGGAAGGARGGFGSRGDRGGDRGRGRGRRGPRRGANKNEEKEWQPVTKLGRLVKAGKIKSMEEIYLHSLPIKEYQIVDWFLPKLKDEVMKVGDLSTVMPVFRVLYADIDTNYRSSLSKSKLVPVSVLDSRPLSLSGTLRGTLGLVSRRPKKLLLPFVLPSSSPSLAFCPFVVGTGVLLWVSPIRFLRKRVESVVPSPCE